MNVAALGILINYYLINSYEKISPFCFFCFLFYSASFDHINPKLNEIFLLRNKTFNVVRSTQSMKKMERKGCT
jgi:hypothetical protein